MLYTLSIDGGLHTSLKYLTVVSMALGLVIRQSENGKYVPNVLGNVFSNSRARSGSFNKEFMSEITFCWSDSA